MLMQWGRKKTFALRQWFAGAVPRLAPPPQSAGRDFVFRYVLAAGARDLFIVWQGFRSYSSFERYDRSGSEASGEPPFEATVGRGMWRKHGTVGTTHLCRRIFWRCRGGWICPDAVRRRRVMLLPAFCGRPSGVRGYPGGFYNVAPFLDFASHEGVETLG